MNLNTTELFRTIEIDEDFISAIKYNELSEETYYLFRLRQRSNIFENIKSVDIIFQNNATFGINFLSKDLNRTIDQYTYSNEFSDNELFSYYNNNFNIDPIKNYSENDNNWTSSIISYQKSDLTLIDNEYIYFLISSRDSRFLRYLKKGFVRVIIKNNSNNNLFDSSFIEKNLEEIYLNAKIDQQNLILNFIFSQYTNNLTISYNNTENSFHIDFPELSESFVNSITGTFYYDDKEYPAYYSNMNFPRNGGLGRIILGANPLTYDIITNYNNNVLTYNFNLYVSFNTLDNTNAEGYNIYSSFCKIITKSYERSDRIITQIINNNNTDYNLNNLNRIVLNCNADYIEQGEVLKLSIDYDFSNVFTENVYLKSIIVNNNSVYEIYKSQDLKNNYMPLYNIVNVSEYFDLNSTLNSKELYIDSKNIYSISNIKIIFEYNNGNLINTETISKVFEFNINKSALGLIQIEKFFKFSEFNTKIKDALDIDFDNSIQLKSEKLNVFPIKSLKIKNILGFSTLSENFNYNKYTDNITENTKLLIKNSICNISLKTIICGIEFYKDVYCKLSEVGDFVSNDYIFKDDFLDKTNINLFEIIPTLSVKNEKKFDFLLKNTKNEMLEELNNYDQNYDQSINISQELLIKVIPFPYEVSSLINTGLDSSNNIVANKSSQVSEEDLSFSSFIFYIYIYQIVPNISYDKFIQIKKSYYSPEIEDSTFIISFFDNVYNNYTNSNNIFKKLNSLNKDDFIKVINNLSNNSIYFNKNSSEAKEKLNKEVLTKNSITKNSIHKSGFLNITNNSKNLNPYTNKQNITHNIKVIKSDNITNIFDTKDLIFIYNKNINLKADIIDVILNDTQIKTIDVNLCVVPFVSSVKNSDNINLNIVNNKNIIINKKNNITLSPSIQYFLNYERILSFYFSGIVKNDIQLVNNNDQTYITLKSDNNIIKHDFYKLNHMLYLKDFFSLCISNGFNILDNIHLSYSLNIETVNGEFYKKDYSLKLLEKLDEKIYITDNLDNIIFIKSK